MTTTKKPKPTTSKRTATAKPKRASKPRKQTGRKATSPSPPDDGPKGGAPGMPASPHTAPVPPDDSQELVVFAMRITRAERDLIHATAGSGKASSFVRRVALAAARRDETAIQTVIGEAEARGAK